MKHRFRSAFYLLCWEGAFALAYETWMGPTYISGLAGELGTSIGTVALLTSAPWVGSIGQLVGIWAFQRVHSLKRYTLAVAATARGLWLLPLLAAGLWEWQRHRQGGTGTFPVSAWILLFTCVSLTSALLASSSSVAWMSWMKGLIPDSFQGRFFGTRHRFVMLALIGSNLLGAMWVGWKPGGYYLGYVLLCALALVSAALSTALLARVPDLVHHSAGKESIGSTSSWTKVVMEPLRDPRFLPFLLFSAGFNGAVHISGSYFPYYFTKELGIPMSSVALWSMLTHLGCFLAVGILGRLIDRTSGARGVLWWAGHLICLSPLFYVTRSVEWIRGIAPFEYLVNGMAWAGYYVAMTTMLFKIAPREKSAAYFSVHAAACGLSGAAGTMLGGFLAEQLAPFGGFRALWVISSGMRVLVLWTLFRAWVTGAARAVRAG